RAVRSRGLAGAAPDDPRHRRHPRARLARPRGTAGALPLRAGIRQRHHPHRVGRRSRIASRGRNRRRRDIRRIGDAIMKRFADLFDAIDRTTSTLAKVAAMATYFREAPPGDAAWAVFFLTGRRLKRLLPYASLHQWALAATGVHGWLLDECYALVG